MGAERGPQLLSANAAAGPAAQSSAYPDPDTGSAHHSVTTRLQHVTQRGGGHVALILSLFSFLAFCKSLKFGALLRVHISLPNLIFS